MTRKVFTKLMALFVLLLLFQTVAMELILRHMLERSAGETLHRLGSETLVGSCDRVVGGVADRSVGGQQYCRPFAARGGVCATHRAGVT